MNICPHQDRFSKSIHSKNTISWLPLFLSSFLSETLLFLEITAATLLESWSPTFFGISAILLIDLGSGVRNDVIREEDDSVENMKVALFLNG